MTGQRSGAEYRDATLTHRQSGSATGSVLVLLILLAGIGGWNYHRNWEIEKQTEGTRPYKAYAVDDLEALRSAYDQELLGIRANFDQARRNRVRPTRDGGSIANNIDQFDRTAAASAAIRDAAAGVANSEGEIAQLDRELELRARFGVGMMRHVKRLTTI